MSNVYQEEPERTATMPPIASPNIPGGDTDRGEGAADGPGAMKRWGALAAVCIATVILLVDFMAVSVALPAVHQAVSHHGLDASFAELQWVLEGFVLALAALTLTAGHVADLVGRRPVFLAGSLVLAAGSLVAGLAGTPYVLIGGRVVQGVGGALLFSTGTVLLTDTFRQQGSRVAVAVWGTVTGLGVAVAPALGGLVATALGWRWIFFIQAPAAVAVFLIGRSCISEAARTYPEGRPGPLQDDLLAERGRLDWLGLGLFTAAIGILVLGLVRTPTTLGQWSQSGVLACFACSGFLLMAFLAVEWVAPAPMLDMSLFRQRTFTGSSVAAFGLSAAVLGPFMFLVLYLSYNFSYSVLAVGARLLLLTGVTMAFLPLGGLLARYVPMKFLVGAGLALVAGGLGLVSQASSIDPWPDLAPGLLIAGVGLEMVNPRLASAAAAAVKPGLAAVALRTSSTFRHLGTAIGVAVLGSVFAAHLTDDLSRTISPSEGPVIAGLLLQGHVSQATALAATVAPEGAAVGPLIHHSFGDALHEVFLIAAFIALASAALSLLVRDRDLPRARPVAEEALTVQGVPTVGEGSYEAAAPLAVMSNGRGAVTRLPVATPSTEAGTRGPSDEAASSERDHRLWWIEGADADDKAAAAALGEEPAADGEQATGAEHPTDGEQVARTLSQLLGTASPLAGPLVETEAPQLLDASSAAPAESDGQATGAAERAPEERPSEMALPAVAQADSEQADTEQTGTEQTGTEQTGTEQTGTEQTGTEQADTEQTGTEPKVGPVQGTAHHGTLGLADVTKARRWVRGTVIATRGGPVAGAMVTLVGPDGTEAGHVLTGAGGSFAMGGLGDGTYTVVAAAPTYRPTAQVVTLRFGEVRTTVRLSGVGLVAGRVTKAKDASPLPAEVLLLDRAGAVAARGRADSDGAFVLADVIEGEYDLVVQCDGYRPEQARVQLARGATRTAQLALTGLGHVYGAVLSPDGAWVPGVSVCLSDPAGDMVARTSTDGAGSYHFDGVVEGRYSVGAATSDGQSAKPVAVYVDAGHSAAADLTLPVGAPGAGAAG